jgi:hypothetical protein
MISIIIELEKIATAVAAKKMHTPPVSIFFRPRISANLPKGIEHTAMERMKALITQFRRIVVALNSRPMTGKATFNDVVIKDVRLPTIVATIIMAFLLMLAAGARLREGFSWFKTFPYESYVLVKDYRARFLRMSKTIEKIRKKTHIFLLVRLIDKRFLPSYTEATLKQFSGRFEYNSGGIDARNWKTRC